MVKKLMDDAQMKTRRRTKLFFLFTIILYTLLLYGNTLKNTYSLDDYIIFGNENQLVEEGIAAIGDIFTTTYAATGTVDGEKNSFGYRPIVRLSFAIEYSIFGKNTVAAHTINLLLYLAVVLVLYRVLQRIFRDYSIWFPFIITLLFIAHPVHTEVVASLKNRDELLSMLFSLLTMQLLFKYHDRDRVKYLVFSVLMYALAFLSKPTALAFWLVFPLTLYFFTDMSRKRILIVAGLYTAVFVLAGALPLGLLERVRNYTMVDNPLFFEDDFWKILGTSLYSLGYYLRLLVYPYPLLYFYGYNMIPVVTPANIWALLSLLFHIGIFILAIRKFREKHIISYAILFYLFTVAMFSNLFKPAVGIIAERFLFIPSIPFAIILAWLLFKMFKAAPESKSNRAGRLFFVAFFAGLILVPYSIVTYNRNQDWYSEISLYRADMKYLDNSVKAHDLMGTKLMQKVELELSKPVNVAKFMMPDIRRALGYFDRATEIWPGHTSSWINKGMIYNHPRIAESLLGEGDTAQFHEFKKKAISSFSRAIELSPDDGKALFNLGLTYEYLGNSDSAIYYYRQCIERNPDIINPRSRLANLLLRLGYPQEAIRINEEIIRIDPMNALPYVNFGNYYFVLGDTLKAIESYKEAARRNARPEVYAFLAQYYIDQGDMENARYYRQQYEEAMQNFAP
jgi:tetratricopeptide (TPR) repeat protein